MMWETIEQTTTTTKKNPKKKNPTTTKTTTVAQALGGLQVSRPVSQHQSEFTTHMHTHTSLFL